MHKVTLPDDVSSRLGEGGFPVELCDAAGTPRAVAVHPDLFHEMFEVWANHVFGPAAGEKHPVEADAMTTAEAIEYLRKLVDKHRGAA